MPYSPLLIKPFRDEVTSAGVTELFSLEDVDAAVGPASTGSVLLFFNSVCGCAAGTARPGLRLALESASKKPDKTFSVFAGQDLEATARARNHFPDIPPSSPSFALLKDGELVGFIPKHRIEGRDSQSLASDLKSMFEEIFA